MFCSECPHGTHVLPCPFVHRFRAAGDVLRLRHPQPNPAAFRKEDRMSISSNTPDMPGEEITEIASIFGVFAEIPKAPLKPVVVE